MYVTEAEETQKEEYIVLGRETDSKYAYYTMCCVHIKLTVCYAIFYFSSSF